MPPKKRLKPAPGQPTLSAFISIKDPDQTSSDDGQDSASTKQNSDKIEPDCTTKAQPSAKKSRKIQPSWFKLWPWLFEEGDSMFCRVCVDAKRTNAFVQGCSVFRTSSMSRHEQLQEHKAVSNPQQAKQAQQLQQAVQQIESHRDQAMLQVVKTVLWLAEENIPLAKFESIFRLYNELEVPHIEHLNVSDRVQYASYYTSLEILSAISEVIDFGIADQLKQSPYVTILADESTDLANKKRITLNARIIDSSTLTPHTIFLRDQEYEDGSGVGLASEILTEMFKRDIPIDKLVGFGSDGAVVMSEGNKGVKGVLMQKQPHLVHIHCMAHRLALCTSQAADTVPAIKAYQQWLTSIYYYFHQSSSREQELHKIQEVLNGPVLKYKEVHAVRWLSVYQAVEAIYRTMDPLMSYLHQRVAAKDPKSKGLLKQMATLDHVYITYLLMDVLALVSKLCLTFQAADLDIASAKVAVDSCLSDLQAYKEGTQLFPTHIECFQKDVTCENGYEYKDSGHKLTDKRTNLTSMKSAFINALISNIRKRFPQKTLTDAFFVLAMRGINMGSDDTAAEFGNDEMNTILDHFGEEKTFKGTLSTPKVKKELVRSQWAKAKVIVRSMKYPQDNFVELWQLLAAYHWDELEEVIKLAQIAMILPLHTADCERTFSQQNKILTKSRANLSSEHLDQLIRVRLHSKSGLVVDKNQVLSVWKARKERKLYAIKARV